MAENNINILRKYLPETSCEDINSFIVKYSVRFKISKERATKLGDYRYSLNKQHQISINHNLNKYEFLIVTLHEFAHLLVVENYKKRIEPHGKEWKNEFALLLKEYSEKDIFPKKINDAVILSINSKPFLTSSLRDNLSKTIRDYYGDNVCLEDIPLNSIFTIKNNRKFIKIEKLRKRYKCKEIKSNKIYLVHSLTPIKHYESPD